MRVRVVVERRGLDVRVRVLVEDDAVARPLDVVGGEHALQDEVPGDFTGQFYGNAAVG